MDETNWYLCTIDSYQYAFKIWKKNGKILMWFFLFILIGMHKKRESYALNEDMNNKKKTRKQTWTEFRSKAKKEKFKFVKYSGECFKSFNMYHSVFIPPLSILHLLHSTFVAIQNYHMVSILHFYMLILIPLRFLNSKKRFCSCHLRHFFFSRTTLINVHF